PGPPSASPAASCCASPTPRATSTTTTTAARTVAPASAAARSWSSPTASSVIRARTAGSACARAGCSTPPSPSAAPCAELLLRQVRLADADGLQPLGGRLDQLARRQIEKPEDEGRLAAHFSARVDHLLLHLADLAAVRL